MEIDRNKLPEDPAALRQMVAGLLEELDTKERRLQQLQHMVEQLLRWRYGPKRERVNENQLFLYAVGIIGTGSSAIQSTKRPYAWPRDEPVWRSGRWSKPPASAPLRCVA